VLLFGINCFVSARNGAVAGDNPWKSYGLEWATSSPPPAYNFLYLPTVRDRFELWSAAPDQPVVTGLRSDVRETLVTKLMDADPDHRAELPRPTIWPFALAAANAIGIITAIFTPLGIPLGFVLAAITLIGWFWPKPPHRELLEPPDRGGPPLVLETEAPLR
jgi:cytochrome c oxidase subunit 1